MYNPTAKGNFSGGGFMEIGLMQAGIDVIQSVDIDKAATDSMLRNRHYFPHSVLNRDITTQTVLDQPGSDISVFTYPCTKYSAIADIHGTRTGDDLFLHAFRHLVLEKSEMYIIENVPGMMKFKVVMEAMSKLPGYHINIICPVDASLWLPQRRKRLILVGTRKPFTISAPTDAAKKPSIKQIIEREPVYEMPDYVINRINGKYRDRPIIVDPNDKAAIAPTCVAHYSKDLGTRLVKDKKAQYGLRPFTVREYARLQGIPDDYVFQGTRNDYKLIGNGVPVDMARWVGQQVIKYFN